MVTEPAKIGRYEVERVLGQGGMGRVYLARDPVLGRRVAVKVLRDDLGLPPDVKAELTQRMQQEARAAAAIAHPNLVTLHDMGEDDANGLYLVFEYVEGPTLRERVAKGPLSPHEVAKMATELGSALAFAHDAGVVHRDVKPENVLLSKVGAKLADFGIARLPDSTLTKAGTLLGTPAYSAPEAIARAEHSPASDQFSLACTLYEAIGGRRAFVGDDALSVVAKIANEEPPPLAPTAEDPRLRLLYARVDAALAKGFAKDPAARFRSCSALGTMVAGAIEPPSSGAFPTLRAAEMEAFSHRTSIVPRPVRRAQNVFAGIALVVIVLLVVLGRRRAAEDAPRPDPSASASAPATSAPAPRPRPAPSARPSAAPSAEADAGPTLPQRF